MLWWVAVWGTDGYRCRGSAHFLLPFFFLLSLLPWCLTACCHITVIRRLLVNPSIWAKWTFHSETRKRQTYKNGSLVWEEVGIRACMSKTKPITVLSRLFGTANDSRPNFAAHKLHHGISVLSCTSELTAADPDQSATPLTLCIWWQHGCSHLVEHEWSDCGGQSRSTVIV